MKINGIFSLDIGSKVTGYAYGYPGESPTWGRRGFLGVLPGGAAGIFRAFRDWLDSRFAEYRPAFFVYEPMWISPYAKSVMRLLGMEGVALGLAHERGLKIREYPIKSVAQFHGTAGLKSAAKKRVTRDNMVQRYGFSPVSEDEADALALWLYAEQILDPRSRRCVGPLFTPTREIVDSRCHKPVKNTC